jgi:hypothetical protein
LALKGSVEIFLSFRGPWSKKGKEPLAYSIKVGSSFCFFAVEFRAILLMKWKRIKFVCQWIDKTDPRNQKNKIVNKCAFTGLSDMIDSNRLAPPFLELFSVE